MVWFQWLPRRLFLPVVLLLSLALAACDMAGGPSINTRRPVPVALLVPYGSDQPGHEGLARALENAARLAASDLDGVSVDLRVYPTGANPETAAVSARQAVDEGAKIILGPVFSGPAKAAGDAVKGRNINVLAFSNNPEIAGGNVFILGQTFRNTAERILGYAARHGRARVLLVKENTHAGDVAQEAVRYAAPRVGAEIVGVAGFEFSQSGVVNAVPAIADMAETTGANSLLFTSDAAGALPLLVQLLPENRVGPPEYQFMGLTRWDVPSQTLALPGVQGGWFALPDPELNARFAERYSAAYGVPPHPIAGLAYDGIAAIGALVGQGRSDALSRAALTQPSGFVGVNGVFRLLDDGTNERGLAVATIVDKAVEILDPAPRSFGGAGS
ncbi:MAG: penicillin-binding protein activator [Alphaproteobacteria bacterium]|nr:MAG: penicillin-binding protein activator [Alphaproteobacteria bacterium]